MPDNLPKDPGSQWWLIETWRYLVAAVVVLGGALYGILTHRLWRVSEKSDGCHALYVSKKDHDELKEDQETLRKEIREDMNGLYKGMNGIAADVAFMKGLMSGEDNDKKGKGGC